MSAVTRGKFGTVSGTPGGNPRVLPSLGRPEVPGPRRFRRPTAPLAVQARDLLRAFYVATGRPTLAQKCPPAGDPWRRLAETLNDSRVSGTGYVRWFVSRYRKRYGVFPSQMQVWGRRVVSQWLPEYRRAGAAQSVPTYRPSPERQTHYRDRTPTFGREDEDP